MLKSDSSISELENLLEQKTVELNQRNKQLAVINSVQEGLAKKMDINAIYELVGEKIRGIFNAQVIDIATYNSKTNIMEDHYAYEKGDRTLVGKWEPAGFRKYVVENGLTLLINEELEKKSLEFGGKVIHGEMPKSAVFVPMTSSGVVNGMISLQSLDQEKAFSDSEVSMLKTLANSMSVALENAKLFDETSHLLKETEQRNAELAVINSVQEGLASELDIKAIYELVGEKMRNIFNAQVIDIVTYDPKLNLIEDQYSYEKGDRTLVGPREPKGFRKHVIETSELLKHNDNVDKAMVDFNNEILIGEIPKSQVYAPMIAGGKVKGVISLQNLDQENAFSDSDVSLLSTLVNSMTVALENARLFDETNRLLKETEQRTAELAVINSVQEGLASELDIKAIYEMVGEKMRNIFNPQVIDIVTYNAKENLIEDQYAYEKGDRTLLGAREPNGFRKYVIENKKTLVINKDMENERKAFDNAVVVGEGSKSIVLVPLITGEAVTGIISLQNLDQENAFPEANVNLLNTLANTMSVALENARLFDKTTHLLKETEQRTAELAVINSVQEGLAHELDIQAIYEMVGEKMREIFNAQVIDIVTYDADKNVIEDQYAYEKGDRTMLGPREAKGFRKHVIKTGQLLLHNENVEKAMREFNNEILIGETPKSQVYAPMMAGGKVKGVISLQNLDQEHAFSDADISLLSTLVNSMSVALQNARLFDETSRLLKETEQRTAELAVINSVQEGLANELDIQSIYDLVGDRIRDLFKAQAVVIATLDQEKGEEHFKYVLENGKRFHLEPRPLDKLRQHLIKTKQKIVINKDFEKAFANFGMKVAPGTELPQSTVYVPLIIGDKITSYVSLQNVDHENAFSDADVRLLETLANSMSVALENARLFDETSRLLKETEQRTAELAVINSVQEGLATELDIESIYNLVGERIQNIFDAQAVIIANLDLESKTEIFKFTMENDEKFNLEPRPFDKLRKHLVQTKQKVVINNSGEAFVWFGNKALPGTKPLQSGAFVPLIIGNKITSYISLQNVDKDNAFNESDIRLLETLANSMSVALENARLFDETNRLLKETEQRTSELAVINSVQEGLVREMDINAIYKLVGDRLCELFPDTQTLVIRTFDHKTEKEHFQYIIEKGVFMEEQDLPFNWANKLLIKTKQSLLINENYVELSMKYGGKGVTAGQPPKSAVFVPMIVGEDVKGSISLQNVDKENAFSESDLRLLTTLTNSMSVALENARLFDETAHLLKETEQRTAELAVINSVQDGLAKEMDMQGIYNLVGDRVQTLFKAQIVLISTFDLENKTEKFNYFFENNEKVTAETRPINHLRQLLIDKKHTIHIPTEEEAIKEYGLVPIGETKMPKSLLFVPLMTGIIIRGYVSLQNIDIENAFSDSDIRLLETLANSMSVALENARLFDETTRLLKETEQRTAELAVINSVQDGLAKEMAIQGIYDLVGEKIRDIFHAQVIDIVTYDKKNNLIEDRYSFEKGDRSLLGPRPLKGIRKHVIESGSTIVINNITDEILAKYDQAILSGEKAKSVVMVPMIAGGEINGVISLQNLDQENAFPETDVKLLNTLANSMSVALENARLFDETTRLLKETEQRTAELAVINSVQDGLAKEMAIQGIYDLVGEKIRDIFHAQVIDIVTYDKRNNLIEDRYSFDKGDRNLLGSRPLKGFRKHVIDSASTLVINNITEEIRSKYDQAVLSGEGAKSIVMVPMIAGGEINGVISLQNLDQENAFPESDVKLLNTLANSMSVALENARLFDETTRLLKETEQRTAELAVINSVQGGLAKELEIKGIYDLVGDRIRELFNAQVVGIATLNHAENTEKFQYIFEKGERFYPEPRPLGDLRLHLIKTKSKILINTRKEGIEWFGNEVVEGTEPIKSAVFVPLIIGDKLTSYVTLQNVDTEYAFSESDIRLLETLSNSMSVALENARLFDETNHLLKETEQHKAELAVINSVQEGLVREMDIKAIYELVGNRICDLFDTQTVVIRTFDHKTKNEEWQFVMEKGERLYSKPRPFNWANQQLIKTKQVLLINDNYLEIAKEHGGSGVSKGLPPKSAVFVPMVVGDVVRGSVSLQNVEKENAFSEADMRLLTTLTNSMSVALENARLFDESNRLLGEAKQRASELATVNNITQALASQINLDELITLVGEEIRQLFKANIVYVALLDQKTNIINFPHQFGDTMDPMELGEGLTSKIILSGEPLLINKDIRDIEAQMGIKTVGIPAASYLGVPISVGDENIGVLSVQSTEQENRFGSDDMRLLQTIATSVGVALRKATLFEEIHMAKMDAEEAKKTAEKANEAKSSFLSTVSHELRTPLTSVLGFAKIIKKRLEEKIFPITDRSNPKTDKTIQQISDNLDVVVSEGQRLTHLINDVLDLAKIEAGKMEWDNEPISIPEIAERAIAATTSLIDASNLKLIKNIKTDLSEITGDRDKLIQVLVNLISNAVKFSVKGKVTCDVYQKKDEIIMSITDTGIGIAPQDHAAVFEQFKQVGDTLTDKPKGTGLGLPICKEIVEHHGGRIWLESELGVGSTFFVALPVKKITVEKRPIHLDDLVNQLKEQVAHSKLSVIGSFSTILVVDDDDSIRSLLNQELGEAGYNIIEAANGKQALEAVRKQKPDLIILDIMMPEMNGFDVAAVLKNDPQTMDIPIIVLSIVQDKTRGFRIGVDRYLTKPIDTGLLFSEIGSLLEQGKSKKKVMIVDEDNGTVNTLSEVLKTKGYIVTESNGKQLMENAVAIQPDIIIMNSVLSDNQEIVKSLRFEKGLENVLFLVYQ